MHVKLIELTEDAEQLMVYIARVSNPSNQDNRNHARLIRYCLEHGHVSIFEHAHMTLEIETSLAIATQILRHRSFTFQQFSQRYADASQLGFEPLQLREQSEKNRQSSVAVIDLEKNTHYQQRWNFLCGQLEGLYADMLKDGVARECARMVLPQCTATRLYMTGNVRSWIHYLQLRTQPDTQGEHRAVAVAAQAIFVEKLPVVAAALGWTGGADEGAPATDSGPVGLMVGNGHGSND